MHVGPIVPMIDHTVKLSKRILTNKQRYKCLCFHYNNLVRLSHSVTVT